MDDMENMFTEKKEKTPNVADTTNLNQEDIRLIAENSKYILPNDEGELTDYICKIFALDMLTKVILLLLLNIS